MTTKVQGSTPAAQTSAPADEAKKATPTGVANSESTMASGAKESATEGYFGKVWSSIKGVGSALLSIPKSIYTFFKTLLFGCSFCPGGKKVEEAKTEAEAKPTEATAQNNQEQKSSEEVKS